MYTYTYTYIYTHTHTLTYIHAYIPTYIYTHTHIYLFMYIFVACYKQRCKPTGAACSKCARCKMSLALHGAKACVVKHKKRLHAMRHLLATCTTFSHSCFLAVSNTAPFRALLAPRGPSVNSLTKPDSSETEPRAAATAAWGTTKRTLHDWDSKEPQAARPPFPGLSMLPSADPSDAIASL